MTNKNNPKKSSLKWAVVPWKMLYRLALMIGTGLLISACASVRAPDEVADSTFSNRLMQKIDERDRKIAERDKAIDDLQRRVQQLEHNNAVYSQPNKPANTALAAAKIDPSEKIGATPPPPINQPLNEKKTAATQQDKAAPGSFEVDEEAAQRALERTLVQTGALLLPFGQAEIQPFVTYSRRETKQPLLFTTNNTLQVANARIRRNEFDMGVNFLVGLPFESQAELRIPYQVINQSVVLPDGSGSKEISNTGNSFGDFSVGLAKTLTHESDWIPDLIARLAWDTASGSVSNNNVAMGGGFNDFTASMTALKRQDPLAFTARVTYQKTLKKNGIEPGDRLGFSIGATLAASPQTSLSLGLEQTYSQETKINNVKVQGSDNISSVFTVGASSTIGRRLFFSVLGGIGLTESSPDYFLNITIPFRLDIPFKSTENKY
ncbi:MAG: hypothetical protein ACXW04_04080 [Methylobacter sp.]